MLYKGMAAYFMGTRRFFSTVKQLEREAEQRRATFSFNLRIFAACSDVCGDMPEVRGP
jgi:hypothetical protein